ncbi:MAG TPA: phosphopantetheine-binding protein, partial [Kofleriaceae bacterium]
MAESHMAFLRAFEAAHFSGAAGATAERLAAMPAPGSAFVAGGPRPVAHTASPVTYAAGPPPVAYASAPSPVAASPSPVAAMSPAPVPTHATPRDLEALLLAVVADKTGYPAEMIDTTMDLESDLGIDSIKRVEILAAIRERAPGLPEVEPAHMASLRTVRAIVGFLRDGAKGPVNGPVTTAPPDGAARDGAASDGVATARLVPRVVAAPAVGLAMPGLVGGRIAVTDDGGGVAHALVARLRGHGLEADVVDAVPEDAGAVVFLGGLREIVAVDDVVAVHRAAFEAARAVAGRFQTVGGAFVTVEEIGGDFGLSGSAGDRAWLAGVGALAKTVAREWPRAAVRAIDIAREGRSAEVVAEALADELLGGGTELEVGLSADGARITIATMADPAAAPSGISNGVAGRSLEALSARRAPAERGAPPDRAI